MATQRTAPLVTSHGHSLAVLGTSAALKETCAYYALNILSTTKQGEQLNSSSPTQGLIHRSRHTSLCHSPELGTKGSRDLGSPWYSRTGWLGVKHQFTVFVCLYVFVVILVFVCFVASDVLTTICHLAIVNVCVIIILSIGNTQAYCFCVPCTYLLRLWLRWTDKILFKQLTYLLGDPGRGQLERHSSWQ